MSDGMNAHIVLRELNIEIENLFENIAKWQNIADGLARAVAMVDSGLKVSDPLVYKYIQAHLEEVDD